MIRKARTFAWPLTGPSRTALTYGANPPSKSRCVQVQSFGNFSIATISGDATLRTQSRKLRKAMSQLPTTQDHLILDVSSIDEDVDQLPKLVFMAVVHAQRCQISVSVCGVSQSALAVFEVTRVNRIVRCFSDRRSAICHIMADETPVIAHA